MSSTISNVQEVSLDARIVESRGISNINQLEARWILILANLTEALNQSQNIRDFKDARYKAFLEELNRMGIFYNEASNSFFHDPTESEWERIKQRVLAKEIELTDATIQNAAQNRFKFNQNLPPVEETALLSNLSTVITDGFSSIVESNPFKALFSSKEEQEKEAVEKERKDKEAAQAKAEKEAKITETEKLLAAAFFAVTEVYNDNAHFFAEGQRYHPTALVERLKVKKDSHELSGDTAAQDQIEQKVAAAANYTKKLAELKAASTLEEKIKFFKELNQMITSDSNAMADDEIAVVLAEANEAMREAAHYTDRATVRTPLLSSLDKLAERLVDFIDSKTTVKSNSVSVAHVLSTALALKEEALEEKKRSLPEKIAAAKADKSQKEESIRQSKENQAKKDKTAELVAKQKGLQAELHTIVNEGDILKIKQRSVEQDLHMADWERDSLTDQKDKLQAAKEEAQKNFDENDAKIENLQKELTELGPTFDTLNSEISALGIEVKKLTSAQENMQKETTSLEKEFSAQALAEAIDELVRNHQYLSTKRSLVSRLFGKSLLSDADLAADLAKSKAYLADPNKTSREKSDAALELIQHITTFLKGTEENPSAYQASDERKRDLLQLVKLCQKYRGVQGRQYILEKTGIAITEKRASLTDKNEKKKVLENSIRSKETEKEIRENNTAALRDTAAKAKSAYDNSSSSMHQQLQEAEKAVQAKEAAFNEASKNLDEKKARATVIADRLSALETELKDNFVDPAEKILTAKELSVLDSEIAQLSKQIETDQENLAEIPTAIASLKEQSDKLIGHLRASETSATASEESIKQAEENAHLAATVSTSATNSSPNKKKKSNKGKTRYVEIEAGEPTPPQATTAETDKATAALRAKAETEQRDRVSQEAARKAGLLAKLNTAFGGPQHNNVDIAIDVEKQSVMAGGPL